MVRLRIEQVFDFGSVNFDAMKKLLITGASGFLGQYLCSLAPAGWQVHGIGHHHPGLNGERLDLTDESALQDYFQTLQPDAVIHAAAMSQPNACEDNPIASHQINVVASHHLAHLCAAAGIPLLFTSSEQVFDGLNPPYRESDRVCPINLYGEQKVAAEVGILQRHPGATICRMPLMYGAIGSFIQPFIARLRSGETLNLFTDEIRTPVSGTAAAQGIFIALEKRVQGYLHLGGRERLSRYAMGLLLVELLQIQNPNINACRQADVKMAARRAPDTSLDSAIAFGLGYAPETMRQGLREVLGLDA
jgi:dTDP-4-dehydrorhamnose reductase